MRAPVTTGLVVRRADDYCGLCRRLRVLVDGREVGAVAYGGRAAFALPPGVHSVQVAMDWCVSEPRRVRVRAGEVAEVEGGLRWRGLLWVRSLVSAFLDPDRVFVVRALGSGPGSAEPGAAADPRLITGSSAHRGSAGG